MAESLERPDQAELSQDAVRGLVALLLLVQSELKDIEEKVGVVDRACFEERAVGEENSRSSGGGITCRMQLPKVGGDSKELDLQFRAAEGFWTCRAGLNPYEKAKGGQNVVRGIDCTHQEKAAQPPGWSGPEEGYH